VGLLLQLNTIQKYAGVPMNFSEAAKELVPTFDQIYDQWSKDSTILSTEFQTFNPLTQVQCKKGCGACCHFPTISATAGEAFVVLVKLLGSGQTLSQIWQQLEPYTLNYFSKVKEFGGMPFTNAVQKQFLKEPTPCPFFVKETKSTSTHSSILDQLSGHCGIFNIRPNICESYHSTDHPSLCAQKMPHGMMDSIIDRTDQCVAELRFAERSLLGRSAVGHFPLLLAALCTNEGLNCFLKDVEIVPEIDELGEEDWATSQHMADFDLFVEMMKSIGYAVTSEDIHSLIAAQQSLEKNHSESAL
jgi:Fe-S-cluster containining protein